MKIVTLVAATPAAPPPPNFSEWGLGGAVGLLLLREFAQWFRRKEADESSLVKSLVEAQQSQIKALTDSQRQTAEAMHQLNENLNATLRSALAELRRQHTETQQRSHQAATRIHDRLDAIERKVMIPSDSLDGVVRSRIPS